ncbi:hypothetical protein ADK37_10335 [Streptomyces resistomycificus]|uniref:Uncharacterized protein n=2 Tax=Streptomyces resistomycificus TaxID=67356 RepID=A0A0L8LJ62_9ACTN|nr:hypothetical protein ADK37_10335 [Streptomyces resistomycificus]
MVSMNATQMQGLIGMLAVLGLLVLMVTPAVIGILHERRVDRQIKEAQNQRSSGRRMARAA